MLCLNHVAFSYEKEKPVISDFSLFLENRSRICLMGPSGQGKTTLLRIIAGLEQPTAGSISFTNGIRPNISCVFQEDRLLPWKTVRENAAFFSDREHAQHMLKALALEDAADQMPAELSGGMSRRVALSRALCAPFELLLLDEAFTGLDKDTKLRCLKTTAQALEGKTLVMASHDASEAEALGAKILSLSSCPGQTIRP